MENLRDKPSVIRPTTHDVIHRHSEISECQNIQRVWMAVSGQLGELKLSHSDKNFFEQKCVFRFCINESLREIQTVFHGNFFPQTIEQARLNALPVALYEFIGHLNYEDDEGLKCWDLGIVSSREEFLSAIQELMQQQEEYKPSFPSRFDPVRMMKKFGSVHLLNVGRNDSKQIMFGDNFRLRW